MENSNSSARTFAVVAATIAIVVGVIASAIVAYLIFVQNANISSATFVPTFVPIFVGFITLAANSKKRFK